MATIQPISDLAAPPRRTGTGLLVLLSAMPPDQLENVLANLKAAFPQDEFLVASPDGIAEDAHPSLHLLATPANTTAWVLTASDFVNAYQLAQKNEAPAILMLGSESSSLGSAALRSLANAAVSGQADLAVPNYEISSRAAMINSAIVYPMTRALFCSRVRFPLAIDLGLSMRMAERLSNAAQRFTGSSPDETVLWPVSEATVAGFGLEQIDVGPRVLPHPAGLDLNTILPLIVGSLFSDIEAKAAYWQRSRLLPPATGAAAVTRYAQPVDAAAEIAPMLQAFHLAYSNLQEVWRLVLPPQSLLGLKRLSETDAKAFRMPDGLWARIVFDFLLAHRLRTINRGHLLGALIPLYLAWVASHINLAASGVSPDSHIEAVAACFEAEKPYMVSRWRWPDRFNP